MIELHFEIVTEVSNRFPNIVVCAMRASGVVKASTAFDTAMLLQEAASSSAVDEGSLVQHPVITGWRMAYSSMGVKPSRYRSSIEALARRVAKGGDLCLPIPAVNLYNACSLRAWAPLGAYDIDRLPSDSLQLRAARPNTDQFNPLGAEASAFPLTPSLVVYAAENHVLCWGFNVRDSRAAALLETSDDVAFFSEAVAPEQREHSENALRELRAYLTDHGAACSPVMEATRDDPCFVLPAPSCN